MTVSLGAAAPFWASLLWTTLIILSFGIGFLWGACYREFYHGRSIQDLYRINVGCVDVQAKRAGNLAGRVSVLVAVSRPRTVERCGSPLCFAVLSRVVRYGKRRDQKHDPDERTKYEPKASGLDADNPKHQT